MCLIFAFLMIVTGLTGSSVFLNQQKTYQDAIANATPSTKAILSVSDTEQLENDLANNQIDYTRIGNTTYVLNYDSSDSAQTAVYETYANNEQIMANTDTIFTVSGTSKYQNTKKLTLSKKEDIPDGMILKDYCDQNGKKLVAVIDTGVNDYAAESKNFTDEKTASDENGHGTTVARTILDNSNGKAVILSLKAMKNDGTGYASDIIKAVQYAREQHVDVINMSISALDTGSSSIIKQFVSQAVADGITVVVSAGNYNSSAQLYVPSNIEGVISVGAIDENNNKIKSSNFAASYYEVADSTSKAAAIFTGKFVSGQDISNEKTNSEITYNKEKVDAPLTSEIGKSVEISEDGTYIATVEYGWNISNDILAKIVNHGSKMYISSKNDISEFIENEETIFDESYNIYHYAFDTTEQCKEALEKISSTKYKDDAVGAFVPSDFKTQGQIRYNGDSTHKSNSSAGFYATEYHSSSYKVNFYITHQEDGTEWVVTMTAYWANYDEVNQGGDAVDSTPVSIISGGRTWSTNKGQSTPSFGIKHDGTPNPNGTTGTLGRGKFTGFSGTNLTVTAHVDFSKPGVWNHLNAGGTSSKDVTVTGFNAGWFCNVDILNPAGAEKTDGSVGKFTTSLNDGGSITGPDFYKEGFTTQRVTISNISLVNGYVLSSVSNVANSGNGSYYVDINYTNRNPQIKTRWAKVTVNPNGGNLNGKKDNSTFTASKVNESLDLGTPTRAGYIFTGWSQSGGGSLNGNKYSYGNSDGSITANWKRGTFTLTVDGNGGTVESISSKQYTMTLEDTANNAIASSKFTKTGYTFTGLYTSKDGGVQVYDANGNCIRNSSYWNNEGKWIYTSNLTLYAHWNANNYTLTAHANGSNASLVGGNFNNSTDASVTVTYDSPNYYILGTASRAGYTFEGFYTGKAKNGSKVFDANGAATNEGTYWKDNKWHSTNNLDVYSGWTAHTYTIKFDGNQGYVPAGAIETVQGSMNDQGRTYDDGMALPDTGFTWQGHTFLGWSTNADATVPTWDNKSTANITADDNAVVTLYAVWSTNLYTVSVNPSEGTWNGSAAVQKNTQPWGTEIDLGQPIPNDKTAVITYANIDGAENTRESDTISWVFKNWSLSDNDHGFFDQKFGMHASESGKYTFQSSNDTITANYYYTSVTLPNPAKEGLTFLGWYKDADFTKKAGNGGEVYRAAESETLYARWEKNTFNYSDTIQAFMQDKSGTTEGVFIRKVNGYTGQQLTDVDGVGFVIGLYKKSVSQSTLALTVDTSKGVYNKQNKLVIGANETDGNGYYKIDGLLKVGTTYVVHEISAPAGYTLDDDQTFTFTGDKRQTITVMDYPFPPKTEKYSKLDKYNRPIGNAKFQLKDETTGEIVADVNNALSTDKDGNFNNSKMFKLCKAGHRYSLTEIEVPEGYEKAPVTYFTMPERTGEEMPIIQIEEPTKEASKLKIRKVDSDDNPLEGATFDLYMKDDQGNMVACMMDKNTGEWVNEAVESENVVRMSLTTDSNGEITFTNLPLRASYTGTEPDFTKSYYLVETKSPDGYSLLTEPVEIRLPDDGNTEFTYTVKDDSVVLTLEAGGKGSTMIYCCGAVLLIGAFISLSLRKRKA